MDQTYDFDHQNKMSGLSHLFFPFLLVCLAIFLGIEEAVQLVFEED